MWYRLLYGTISFLCFTWLLFTWGVIDNGKIKLIRMNDETVKGMLRKAGLKVTNQRMMAHILPVRQCSLTGLPGGM